MAILSGSICLSDIPREQMKKIKCRNFSSAQCGIYIPSPDEERLIQLMEIEVEQNKFHI